MIELAQHIEFLLLENDCVILPNFGGFVAHYAEASYDAEGHLFIPPQRTIGFNAQLRLNDGLLVQSVMEVYGTNFGDAQKMVKRWVSQLKERLFEEGCAELANVGELRMSIRGSVDFSPYDSRLTTSWLYGLGSFEMPLLAEQPKTVALSTERLILRTPTRRTPSTHRWKRNWQLPKVPTVSLSDVVKQPVVVKLNRAMVHTAAAVAAVWALFFFFSTPVKNTDVTAAHYAHVMPTELFSAIEGRSLAMRQVKLTQDEKKPVVVERTVVKAKKPAATKTEPAPKAVAKPVIAVAKPAESVAEQKRPAVAAKPVQKVESKKAPATNYHLIVASVPTEKDAIVMRDQLISQGHRGATCIVRDGKNRVSLQSFGTHAEACQAMERLRKEPKYAGAWVLHLRVK